MAFTIRSGPGPSGLDVDMAPVAMDSLFDRDPAWGSGPLFTEPRGTPGRRISAVRDCSLSQAPRLVPLPA